MCYRSVHGGIGLAHEFAYGSTDFQVWMKLIPTSLIIQRVKLAKELEHKKTVLRNLVMQELRQISAAIVLNVNSPNDMAVMIHYQPPQMPFVRSKSLWFYPFIFIGNIVWFMCDRSWWFRVFPFIFPSPSSPSGFCPYNSTTQRSSIF